MFPSCGMESAINHVASGSECGMNSVIHVAPGSDCGMEPVINHGAQRSGCGVEPMNHVAPVGSVGCRSDVRASLRASGPSALRLSICCVLHAVMHPACKAIRTFIIVHLKTVNLSSNDVFVWNCTIVHQRSKTHSSDAWLSTGSSPLDAGHHPLRPLEVKGKTPLRLPVVEGPLRPAWIEGSHLRHGVVKGMVFSSVVGCSSASDISDPND